MERIRPILFNTEMVRAILAGRKTVTRRVVKQVVWEDFVCEGGKMLHYFDQKRNIFESPIYKAPYQVGDILYVRETWNYGYIETSDEPGNSEEWFEPLQLDEEHGTYIEALSRYFYKADDAPGSDVGMVWRPSIHMPKEVARIWLKVTDVRVERLQEATNPIKYPHGKDNTIIREGFKRTCDFIDCWNSTIKKSDLDKYGWNANPWVWVTEFERCGKPESEGA